MVSHNEVVAGEGAPWAPPLVEMTGGIVGHLLAWERHEGDERQPTACLERLEIHLEPDGDVAVGVDAPPIGERVDEEQPPSGLAPTLGATDLGLLEPWSGVAHLHVKRLRARLHRDADRFARRAVQDAVGDDLGHQQLGALHRIGVEEALERLGHPARETCRLRSGREIRFGCAAVVNAYAIHPFIKVVASDAPDNPPGQKLTGERLSEPVDIDNTPPVVKATGQPQLTGDKVRVVFAVDDATGKVKKADASLDGAAWIPVFPDDGIADSGHEVYTVEFGSLGPGEHTISLRTFDTSGNIGTLCVTIRR